ncbi:WD40-repeat-containing domain protein [Suillus spraguei]|nr:WD40-repeat-containing domain protein [Suillus spraguei]
MSEVIPITSTPLRKFKVHEDCLNAVAVLPDKRRMVTASRDKTLRLWDLKTRVVLKKMEGHRNSVLSLAVSRDGQLIASGDGGGYLIIWHGETGKSLTQPIDAHSKWISSLEFSPDGKVLASGSFDKLTKLWNTKTWQQQADPIRCGNNIHCIRYSPSGELLAIATLYNIQIYNSGTRERASFRGHTNWNTSLTWTPDGTCLLTGGDSIDPTIREWDTYINLAADKNTSSYTTCITFSVDGKHILSGGVDEMISEWAVSNDIISKIFANRSKAKLDKMLWKNALLDAQKVIELNSSSHIAYQLMHAALRGLQCYDEAIDAFTIMLSKLDHAPEAHVRGLRQQYIYRSQVENAIQRAVWKELEYSPLHLLNTSTGLLCDRAAQMSTFKTSAEYKELLSSTTKHSDLQMGLITDVVVKYFRCVLLSHRWEETEAVLPDIQDKVVYELNGLGGIAKLQSFCKVARDAGYRWAWMDTCCIDKRSSTEVQESVNSMFVWYHHSALTIVYLSDVPPSSQPGALARSVWNERGWTFQEFVAPKVVIFYQRDWSLYLGNRSPNHKELPAIMRERTGPGDLLSRYEWRAGETAVGIEACHHFAGRCRVLIIWHLWHHATFSSLRQTMHTNRASEFYEQLEQLSAPRFANCRLHLPCISFRVMEVGRSRGLAQDMYYMKAEGLNDLLITTKEPLPLFSCARPSRRTLLLVRPWDRYLLEAPDLAEQPDFTDDTESTGNWRESESAVDDSQLYNFKTFPGGSPIDEEPDSRALRLMVRLGQPFDAFLLAQKHIGEYRRIASDHNIVAQVKDITSVDNMDIRTVEIL